LRLLKTSRFSGGIIFCWQTIVNEYETWINQAAVAEVERINHNNNLIQTMQALTGDLPK